MSDPIDPEYVRRLEALAAAVGPALIHADIAPAFVRVMGNGSIVAARWAAVRDALAAVRLYRQQRQPRPAEHRPPDPHGRRTGSGGEHLGGYGPRGSYAAAVERQLRKDR